MFGFGKKKSKEYDPMAISGIGIPTSPHPLRGWTNFGMFEVHGLNPSTGRENKRTLEALTSADAKNKALAAGLVEPISVSEVQRPMATERQIAYGKSLGIEITPDMSMVDASASICRVNDGESFRDIISRKQWVDACEAGVVISALSGPKCYLSSMKAGRSDE
jgi:hypothetical protein